MRDVCRRIWEDDYVPGVFGDWVRDRRGRLWVACVGDRVVAVAKLSLIGDREAWLHALRVDPRYQRRGIAAALLDHRLERARRLGARVARLDTSEDNVAVRRLMRRFGFRRVGTYAFFVAPARAAPPPRAACLGELARLWRLTRESDGFIVEPYVRRRVSRLDISRAIRAGRCFVTGDEARPTAMAVVEPWGDRLRLPHLSGRGPDLRALLRALPSVARRERKRHVAVSMPAPRWAAARAAGYRRVWHEAMLVFERRL